MVCTIYAYSMKHADMPGGLEEFRVSSWKLNKDYSIDIQARSTGDSMQDLYRDHAPCKLEVLPAVLRSGPYRFFFYSADRDEPPHVHVESSRGFARTELRRMEALVGENGAFLVRAWHEYFGN